MKLLVCALAFLTVTQATNWPQVDSKKCTSLSKMKMCDPHISEWWDLCKGEMQAKFPGIMETNAPGSSLMEALVKGPLLKCLKNKSEEKQEKSHCFDCLCSSFAFSELSIICDWDHLKIMKQDMRHISY